MIKTVPQDKTFEVIKDSVNELVNFVSPTYGPAGRKAVINKNLYKMTIDDGVQIARDYESLDPARQSIINVVKEVAIKTNDLVGDGTTSSLLMVRAIINEAANMNPIKNGHRIEEELKKGLAEAKLQLKKKSKSITTQKELQQVAKISFNDDGISKIIADLTWKVGVDGVIAIEQSPTMETTSEKISGLEVKSGYISRYMVNTERMESILENTYVLVTDYRLTGVNDVLPIMEKLAAAGTPNLVFFAENVEQGALNTIIANRLQGKFNAIAVAISGENRKDILENIALVTGATIISEDKGNKMENVEIKHLGKAHKIVAKQDKTTIFSNSKNKKGITEAIKRIKDQANSTKSIKEKERLLKRAAELSDGIAVIKVGAPTDNEARALKYKVEDAVNAVRVAYRGGIVSGAGLALASITTSSQILNKALQYPAKQLKSNSGFEDIVLNKDDAYNAITGEIGNYLKLGIVDPVEVLIAGIESAVSIASLLVTSCGIIYEVDENTKE